MQFTSLFPIGQLACQIVYVVMQYFLTASFCWMLVEGINIYNKIVLVFNRGSCNKKLFYLVGWGKWWQWENYKVVWIRIISHNYANFCEIFCKFSAKLFCERAAVTEADPCHRIGPLGLFQISHKQPKERGFSKIFWDWLNCKIENFRLINDDRPNGVCILIEHASHNIAYVPDQSLFPPNSLLKTSVTHLLATFWYHLRLF